MRNKWKKISLEEYRKHKENNVSDNYKKYVLGNIILPEFKDGEPCNHKGCLNHISHPCEGCGRIGGSNKLTKEYYEK